MEANYQRQINKTISVDPICPVTLPLLALTLRDLDEIVAEVLLLIAILCNKVVTDSCLDCIGALI